MKRRQRKQRLKHTRLDSRGWQARLMREYLFDSQGSTRVFVHQVPFWEKVADFGVPAKFALVDENAESYDCEEL